MLNVSFEVKVGERELTCHLCREKTRDMLCVHNAGVRPEMNYPLCLVCMRAETVEVSYDLILRNMKQRQVVEWI